MDNGLLVMSDAFGPNASPGIVVLYPPAGNNGCNESVSAGTPSFKNKEAQLPT